MDRQQQLDSVLVRLEYPVSVRALATSIGTSPQYTGKLLRGSSFSFHYISVWRENDRYSKLIFPVRWFARECRVWVRDVAGIDPETVLLGLHNGRVNAPAGGL
jgi:hypothetical protein